MLAPGVHPNRSSGYDYTFAGNKVSAFPAAVGDPFGGGLRSWADPGVSWALRAAHANPAMSAEVRALLPWALTTVTARSPSALGLFARAGYAGPGATGLLDNLGHRHRADALAAELVVAATLVTWPSVSLPGRAGESAALGGPDLRADFGVKMLGGAVRRTVEADILLTDDSGMRRAVDVKHSVTGVYRHPPSRPVLDVLVTALARSEVSSFHLVATGRFRPAVHDVFAGRAAMHVHENVWPNAAQRTDIRLREAMAVDYARCIREVEIGPELLRAVTAASVSAYRSAYGANSNPIELVRTSRRMTLETAVDERALVIGDVSAIVADGTGDLHPCPLPTAFDPVTAGLAAFADVQARKPYGDAPDLLGRVLARAHPLSELLPTNKPSLVFTRSVLPGAAGLPGEVESLVFTSSGAVLTRAFVTGEPHPLSSPL